MPELKVVFNEFLSKTLNMDDNGVASLFNEDESLKDDSLEVLINKFTEKIQSVTPDKKKIFDEAYSRGKSESLSKFEKDAKAKFGLQSDKQGIELLEDLVSKYKEDHPEDPEKIKKSKFYIDAIEEFNNKSKLLETEYNSKLETFVKTVERKELFGNVSKEALVILENLKPVLPEDAAKGAKWKEVFISELSGYDYTIREGVIILLDKEGNDLVDKLQNRIKFEDIVKQTAEKYFDFHVSDPKQAPGYKAPKTPNSTVFNITSEADYLAKRATVSAEDKPALLEAYNRYRGRK